MFKKILLITISGVLLTACEPTVFGVPQSEWNNLTPTQQTQVIQGYNERKQIEETNKPLTDAISVASSALQNVTTKQPYQPMLSPQPFCCH
jgi:hypothetical protein